MKQKSLVVFLLLFISFLSVSDSYAQQDWKVKLDRKVLEQYNAGQSLDIIVCLKSKADISAAKYIKNKKDKTSYVFKELQKTAKSSQQPLISLLNSRKVYYQSFLIVNAIHVKCPSSLLQELASMEEVKSIIDNGPLKFHEPVEKHTDVLRGPASIEWGIDMINANDVWALGFKGQGVTVGGEDTGYDWTHPALISNYRGWNGSSVDHNYNWHDAIHSINPVFIDTAGNSTPNPCGLSIKEPCDDNSHGTHTMGTMCGFTDGDTTGVAPAAKWIGARNMERGWGSPATYIEAFEWFIAPTDLNNENPDPTKSPEVINNSWGCPPSEGCNLSNFAIMNEVVKIVKQSGIVVVVSAGNSGSNCSSIDDPAALFEESFSVGATKQNDTIANFSSRGPVAIDSSFRTKPNVSAPGVGVRSSIPGGGYAFFSGTSMAGPHVAGAVALIISAVPSIAGNVELIEDILEQTAVPKTSDQDCGGIPGTAVPNNTYGYGRIDVFAAVNKALQITHSVDPNAQSKIKVYPNPVKDALYLDCNDITGSIKLEVFELTGKLVFTHKDEVSGRKIVKAIVPAELHGMYLYKVTSKDLQISGKFIKL